MVCGGREGPPPRKTESRKKTSSQHILAIVVSFHFTDKETHSVGATARQKPAGKPTGHPICPRAAKWPPSERGRPKGSTVAGEASGAVPDGMRMGNVGKGTFRRRRLDLQRRRNANEAARVRRGSTLAGPGIAHTNKTHTRRAGGVNKGARLGQSVLFSHAGGRRSQKIGV